MPATKPEGPARRVGFGIVGCGRIGRWHAVSLQAVAGAELVGVSDLERRPREEFARKFGSRAFDTARPFSKRRRSRLSRSARRPPATPI